jgi:ketosteroid isomerase-like protein
LVPIDRAAGESQLDLEIKQLEEAEAEAVMRGNVEALDRLYADGFTINAADNRIHSRKEALGAIRTGEIDYIEYKREVEHIADYGDTVVVMGRETVARGDGPSAGKKVTRRYTHVWVKQDGNWKLAARHANPAAPDGHRATRTNR